MAHLDELRDHPFLKGLRDSMLARIDSCCTSAVAFEAGDQIFTTGDEARACYLIQTGQVELRADGAVIEVLGDGSVLGWSWLYPPFTWRFDAVATAPTTALALAAEPLRQAKSDDADLARELMMRFASVMIDRLQHTRARLVEALGS